MLKDLGAERAWISALQERIFNESSISLNDNDNQKLLDHYYVGCPLLFGAVLM